MESEEIQRLKQQDRLTVRRDGEEIIDPTDDAVTVL